jgi:hypothetical protein
VATDARRIDDGDPSRILRDVSVGISFAAIIFKVL